MKNVREKHRLSILLVVILAAGLMSLSLDAQSESPDAETMQTVEGYVSAINVEDFHAFEVTYKSNGETKTSLCTASTTFSELFDSGDISVGSRVLALVDLETMTGTVFDSVNIFVKLDPEPEPIPEPEPTPEPELPEIELPEGVELVSCDPSPNPEHVAPTGKVKLTVVIHPGDVTGITTNIPSGVYYVEEGRKLLFTCKSENPSWEFIYWNIGMGARGSLKKSGVGVEHYLRVTMETDIVLMAFHKELI